MTVTINDCNPFLRAAEIQPAVLEGEGMRLAYDHRIFCVLSNGGTLLLENESIAISKGTVIFLPPETGYYFRGKMRVAVLNFDMTRSCADRATPITPSPVSEYDFSRVFDKTLADGFTRPLTFDRGESLLPSVIEIVTHFKNRDSFADAHTSGLLKAFLVSFLKVNGGSADVESDLINRVMGYIRLYATEVTGNKDIAKHFGYHPVYLATLFSQKTGKTLHRAVLEQRISIACRWLKQTSISVEEIAFNVGFSSRSHFCTVFRNTVGMSPNKWRNKIS